MELAAPNVLLLPKEVMELDGVPKTLWEMIGPFWKGFVETVLEVDGILNGFDGGVSVVGAPEVFASEVKPKGDAKGFGLEWFSNTVVDLLVEVWAPLAGFSSSERSVMKSELLPASSGDIASSLDESSTIPLAAAADAVMPLMTAGRVRPRRLLSTNVREKTCFRRNTESTTTVKSINQTPKLDL